MQVTEINPAQKRVVTRGDVLPLNHPAKRLRTDNEGKPVPDSGAYRLLREYELEPSKSLPPSRSKSLSKVNSHLILRRNEFMCCVCFRGHVILLILAFECELDS